MTELEKHVVLGRDQLARLRAAGKRRRRGLNTGEAALLATRATKPGLLHEIPRERFQAVEHHLRAVRVGDAKILSLAQSPASYALRSWAEHHRIAYNWLDADDPAGAALAHVLGRGRADLPLAITPTATIRQATARQLSDNLGLAYHDLGRILDLVVVGAGPAGLAATVYGAAEGLSTLLLDAVATGGQAASSPHIENYIGFPDGISGEQLTSRALIQAQKFGATVSTPTAVDNLESLDHVIALHLTDGTEIHAQAVIIATGASYRRLALRRWHEFEGAGIFFAATEIEAEFCRGEPVIVVGGANSSGQAALFLASRGSPVNLVVRHDKLEDGMSDYLARRIREHPRIDTYLGTDVTALHGRDHLSGVDLTSRSDGTVQQRPCAALFCFIGATPATEWLDGVSLDHTDSC